MEASTRTVRTSGTGGEEELGVDVSAMLAAVQEHWLGSFVLNLIGYALIIVPAALLIRRLKTSTAIKNGTRRARGMVGSLVDGACLRAVS